VHLKLLALLVYRRFSALWKSDSFVDKGNLSRVVTCVYGFRRSRPAISANSCRTCGRSSVSTSRRGMIPLMQAETQLAHSQPASLVDGLLRGRWGGLWRVALVSGWRSGRLRTSTGWGRGSSRPRRVGRQAGRGRNSGTRQIEFQRSGITTGSCRLLTRTSRLWPSTRRCVDNARAGSLFSSERCARQTHRSDAPASRATSSAASTFDR
jgi:hypothetical protein